MTVFGMPPAWRVDATYVYRMTEQPTTPISYAEMIAALRFAIQLAKGESFDDCADDLGRVLAHLERAQPVIEAARRWRREEWGSAPSAVIRNSRRHTVDELDESDASMALIDALDALPPSPETPRMSDTPTPETFECFAKQAGEKMCMGCLGEGWGECIYKKYKDTQADLTERARAKRIQPPTAANPEAHYWYARFKMARGTAEHYQQENARLQSEREAAAAEACRAAIQIARLMRNT